MRIYRTRRLQLRVNGHADRSPVCALLRCTYLLVNLLCARARVSVILIDPFTYCQYFILMTCGSCRVWVQKVTGQTHSSAMKLILVLGKQNFVNCNCIVYTRLCNHIGQNPYINYRFSGLISSTRFDVCYFAGHMLTLSRHHPQKNGM